MNTTKIRVSLGYAKLNDDSLLIFATGVHSQLYAQSAYPTPPITAADLMGSINTMRDAKVAQATGGKAATAVKNQARNALEEQLRLLAFYVQLNCGSDLAVLLDSGFEAVDLNRAQTQLVKPVILRIQPRVSGEALVTVTADSNARGFEVRVAEVDDQNVPGPFRPPVIRTGSRNMAVDELVPGKLCLFQVRAIGGLTGFSDWSDAVVQRAA